MTDAAGAREQARDILSEQRFQDPDLPQPLKGPLEDLGGVLEDIVQPLEDLFDSVAGGLPGGSTTLGILLLLAALAAAGAVALRLSRRRETRVAQAVAATAGERERAADLRRRADDAEHAGDLDGAVRLRFRAGLLELGERELLDMRPGLLNAEVRALGSPTLDGLTADFEEVAYGGRSADARAVERSREDWPRVPEEVRR